MATDWIRIEARYCDPAEHLSLRELADVEGVSFNTLKTKASAGKWKAKRDAADHKYTTAIKALVVDAAVDEATTIVNQHTNDWSAVRSSIFAFMATTTTDKDEWARLRMKAAFAIEASNALAKIQKGQRLSYGLDKPQEAKTTGTLAEAIAELDARGAELLIDDD